MMKNQASTTQCQKATAAAFNRIKKAELELKILWMFIAESNQ